MQHKKIYISVDALLLYTFVYIGSLCFYPYDMHGTVLKVKAPLLGCQVLDENILTEV